MPNIMPTWQPPPSEIFFSRKDPQDVRLGDLTQAVNLARPDLVAESTVIIGYPDDEGIALNGGRPGARQAPEHIRRMLYRMTPPMNFAQSQLHLRDGGDLIPTSELPARHNTALQTNLTLYRKNNRILSLGGGHDYAYADVAAFLTHFAASDPKPLVINFDAHLDVRPTERGFNSGTPFYRLLEEFCEFTFIEIGIQENCNSQQHRQWLLDKGGVIIDYPTLALAGVAQSETIIRGLAPWIERPRPTFLSLDIDCFATAFAPGCSQSWPLGLMPSEVYTVIDVLLRRTYVAGLGIYEVSPALDLAGMTSKLAAQFAYQFIFGASLSKVDCQL